MIVSTASESGGDARPSEDWHYADADLVVVLDGATVRTDTGCVHGVTWYVEQLGRQLVDLLAAYPRQDLRAALRDAIEAVADLHRGCDLSHPGTPSAGVGVVVDTGRALRWLVLGDVTIAIDAGPDAGDRIQTILDDRVSHTAAGARAEADRYPIGSPEKERALVAMKQEELAARNTPGGYWIAAADPSAADHAYAGVVTSWRQVAVLTDGAARLAEFGVADWRHIFAVLGEAGPAGLIRAVREVERSDPAGERWARNKASDDATAALICPRRVVYAQGDRVRSQWDPALRGSVTGDRGQRNLLVTWDRTQVPVEMPADELRLDDAAELGSSG